MPPLLEDLHYQPHFPLSLYLLQADITHVLCICLFVYLISVPLLRLQTFTGLKHLR